MDNHEWMYMGCPSQCQITDEWINKTKAFLNVAFGEATKGASVMWCPYSSYENRKRKTTKVMVQHL
jgi:hypothetical protein